MAPTPLSFPGFNGPVTASVEQRPGARRAVVVVSDPDDVAAAKEELQAALVEAGFIVAWLPGPHLDATAGLPRVEDLSALVGTVFVSSHETVDLVARGRSCPVALTTVDAAYDLLAGAVLIGAPDDIVKAKPKGPVPIVLLEAAEAPDAVVKAVAHQFDAEVTNGER